MRRRKYTEIQLHDRQITIIDKVDLKRVIDVKWQAKKANVHYYAYSPKYGKMHRYLLNAPPGIQVDHKNGNTLDNRKLNLRLATQSQQTANQKKRSGCTSKFKGVWLQKSNVNGKWMAQINKGKTRVTLGPFPTALQAALAYDLLAVKHHGPFARINFPERF